MDASTASPLQVFALQHALVLGLGASGLGMARWCAQWGAQVSVIDTREQPPEMAALHQHLPKAHFCQALLPVAREADALALLDGIADRAGSRPSMLLLSPGLSPAHTAAFRNLFEAQGLWVTGELGLFEHALGQLRDAEQYTPKVLGITGTNGKTTVTMLTTHLLKRCGLDAVAAGNVGDGMLDVLRERITARRLPQAWVLELSSFQLHANALHAHAAALLNLSEDHLDWHHDFADYASAKARIFGGEGAAIVNRDDGTVASMLGAPDQKDVRGKRSVQPPRVQMSFGSGVPTRAGDFGLETTNGMVWLVRAIAADDSPRRRRAGASEEISIQHLMPADALRIRGHHNALNALAALALCTAIRVPLAAMLYGLREYLGEPHRCVSVAQIDGVEYINDSKGTNVGATVAAIDSVGQEKTVGERSQRLIVILGGVGKGQNFGALAPALTKFAKAIVLLGQDAAQIAVELTQAQESRALQALTPQYAAASLAAALASARALSQPGDAVLLSPACASFDMFKDYVDRGSQFEALVAKLAEGLEEVA